MKRVDIYIEVTYQGKPSGGSGKYYAVLETILSNDQIVTRDVIGGLNNTTKNRLYLTACIKSLERLKEACEVVFYARNLYVMEAIEQEQIYRWQESGWLRRDSKPVKNKDLWEKYITLKGKHLVNAEAVKMHNYSEYLLSQLSKMKIKYEPDTGGRVDV